VQDLRKADLVCLLESPTEIRGVDYYLPSANRFAKEELEGLVISLFRDEVVSDEFKGDGQRRPAREKPTSNSQRQPGREKPKTAQEANDDANNVFVVHGHDEALLLRVQNFLHRLGLNPIVLQDQLNRGRAIIEKLEREAKRVNFAIILLSPDDKGCKSSEDDPRPRARQNIIFEWGWFVGLLGRGRVCALRTGTVEMPSDLDGVVWEAVDGSWEARVAKEMREAGLQVDLNRL